MIADPRWGLQVPVFFLGKVNMAVAAMMGLEMRVSHSGRTFSFCFGLAPLSNQSGSKKNGVKPVTPADITKTVYDAMGIHDLIAYDNQNRPYHLLESGESLISLF
jgi:hypothetical protein